MTNLEWIRTLSAKELSDLLYDYWLPRGQYVWTDSRKGLIKVLNENYLERDCDKCKHQVNCYCVKGLGCPFEPKTENSSEKPNNCDTCRNKGFEGCEQPCLGCGCCGLYEPKDEPQTDKDFKVTYTCSFTDCDNFKNFGFGEKCIECKRKQSKAKYKDEPQTERNRQ